MPCPVDWYQVPCTNMIGKWAEVEPGVWKSEIGHVVKDGKCWIFQPADGSTPFSPGMANEFFTMRWAEDFCLKTRNIA